MKREDIMVVRKKGENMNRGTIWTFTLVIILDYIQMSNLKSYSKLTSSNF
jgi:hypothetical protein